MIIIHAQHFLNADGKNYFAEWLEETGTVLKKFEGFIAVRHIQKLDETEGSHVLLEFENESLLDQWTASSEHQALMGQLDPYRTKALEADRYRVEKFFD